MQQRRLSSSTAAALGLVLAMALGGVTTVRAQRVLAESASTGVRLTGIRQTVSLAIKADQASAVRALAPAPGAPGMTASLVLDGIDYEQGAYYEVYLNLAERETTPTSRSPHFVGVLAPFAMKPPQRDQAGALVQPALDFDLTRTLAALAETKQWTGDALTVTFVPNAAKRRDDAARATAKPTTSPVRIQHIRLVVHTAAPSAAQPAPLKPGQFEWHAERVNAGPLVIIVSLPEQRAYVYRNGLRIGVTTVSTGRAGHLTPTGVFTILQKDRDHRSSLYNSAPMPYMERLTWDGIALHAGNLPGYPASHGCVRLPLEFSKLLYGVTTYATTVVIADKHTADEATLRPGLILSSAHLESHPIVSTLPEPPGQFEWMPERATSGPLTLLLSGADRTVYVHRNGELIGRAGISIADPDQPLPRTVFVMLEGAATEPSAIVPDKPALLWQAVSLQGNESSRPGDETAPPASHDVTARVRVPIAFAREVYAMLVPGTTIMVTDRSAQGATATPPDFAVLASDGGTTARQP